MVKLSSVAEILNGDRSSNYPSGKDFIAYGIPFINAGHLKNGKIDFSNMDYISKQKYEQLSGAKIQKKDILLCLRGSLGKYAVAEIDAGAPASSIAVIRPNETIIASEFLTCIISSFLFQKQIDLENNGSSQPNLSAYSVANFIIPFPPLDEQKRIAEALSDVDGMISSLEKLIAKKKAVKQGAMRELLTGKKRLPGFDGEWITKAISDIAIILDDHRIPVKESDRDKMEGNIPYCGANGVLGYVNDYTIDDEIILIAEDGGYFDEYATRPIAYKMDGKCWVNNHAHIIKAKSCTNQEYLFYSLVHKDIRDFITSGTRSKLNKAELLKITITLPVDFIEQTAIASILSDMDNEIEAQEQKLEKMRQVKQGMMQQLLTGKIRLV